MKKTILIIIAIVASFGLGFAFNSMLANKFNNNIKMKKVTGIGGVFFKCKDPNKVKEWYKTHLGFDTDAYGTNFEWPNGFEYLFFKD